MNTVLDTVKASSLPQRPPAEASPGSIVNRQLNPNTECAAAALHHALELLGRASEDWRGNGTVDVGPLHWPVAVNLARRELATALEALERQQVAEAVTERQAFQAGRP